MEKISKRKVGPEEIEYIRENCLTKTDEEMSAHLKRDKRTIASIRKKLGVKKKHGGKVESYDPSGGHNKDGVIASQRMSEDQRKEFFKIQLTNTLYYSNLKEQFVKEEIDFYLEEWASLCVQFEDIVATEKRQIDELIKAEIMANRILRNIRITEDEINRLVEEVRILNSSHDMADDESAQERDIQLQSMIRTMGAQSQAMSNDYQKNVALRNDLLDQLNARRRDRVDQISKRGTTFLGLIEAFRDRQVREAQGRHMELVKMSKDKKASEWRNPTRFADGTNDCVLMDDKSTIQETEVVRMEDFKEDIIEKYKGLSNKRILIVDDEKERCLYFQRIFQNCSLDFASNADKAINKLKEKTFDLICLDYDLGLEQKGTIVAEYLVSNNLIQDADILVQSMNPAGVKLIKDIFDNSKKQIQIKRFIDIRDMEKKNA